MKLNGINLNNFYTNKSNNIQNRNIKSYQTSPILKTNKSDSVSFTGYMDHFNEMVAEALNDMSTFETLHKKGVELQKDAALKKKEAFKLRLMYNIKANELQELYNEMIENENEITIDDNGNEVILSNDKSGEQTLTVMAGEQPKMIAGVKNGKISSIFLYNDDGLLTALSKEEGLFKVFCDGTTTQVGTPNGDWKKIYMIFDDGRMFYEDDMANIKKENGEEISKVGKAYYFFKGELKNAKLDTQFKRNESPIKNTIKQAYYYLDGKLREVRIGENSTNATPDSCSKNCVYDSNGNGAAYGKGCEFKPDGSKKFDKLFLCSEISFYENVVQKLEDDFASVKMAYVYDPQSGKISVIQNAILTDLPC